MNPAPTAIPEQYEPRNSCTIKRVEGWGWKHAHAKRDLAHKAFHFKLGDSVRFVRSQTTLPYYGQAHRADAAVCSKGYEGTVVGKISDHCIRITLKGSAFCVLPVHLRVVERLSYQRAKIIFLFPLEASSIHKEILYDSVSLYSTTDHLSAIEIARHTLSMRNVSKSSTILDATACIGGNTYAFAKLFKHVHAVEIDHTRAAMLKHNMTVLSVERNVTVHEGDFCILWRSMRGPDTVVFIDPPWGGTDYKYHRTIPLKLGHSELADLCLELCPWFDALVIKVPYNYDYAHFKSVHPSCSCIDVTSKIKLILLSSSTHAGPLLC